MNDVATLPLRTERLLLPAWRDDFAADLAAMTGDPRVARHPGQRPWTRARAAERHRRALDHWSRHGFGWRAVLDAADATFLGVVSLSWLDDALPGIDDPALEIGWWAVADAWGRGTAPEAAGAVLAEAFTRVRIALVVARCAPANRASERVMRKLAMTRHRAVPGQLVYLARPQSPHFSPPGAR
ncbi:GNAT family N-acetyltransferase [Actinomadura kijaniata]|uniref:GNAT family N-acetyltransferase n=1 Tax=Actinomadura kijaniata TaxID=46161 RepID=UPI00082C39F8|nr:GNAT family N-acetyltransferase [Actinomadura kijaniata]